MRCAIDNTTTFIQWWNYIKFWIYINTYKLSKETSIDCTFSTGWDEAKQEKGHQNKNMLGRQNNHLRKSMETDREISQLIYDASSDSGDGIYPIYRQTNVKNRYMAGVKSYWTVNLAAKFMSPWYDHQGPL